MTTFGPSDWFKKAVPLAYTRISTDQQDKSDKSKAEAKEKPTLIDQLDFINKNLKANKLPQVKKKNWFAEVGSGTDRGRPQWIALKGRAAELAMNGKRAFIVVKDPSRWSRNTRHSLVALDRLHDLGVPVFAAREGIQTGSVNDLHPTEELLFVQLQGGASFVSQEQKKKADESVAKSKEEGIMSGKGTSLYPFARMDPLDAFRDQLPLLTLKPSEGGGSEALRMTVHHMTEPNGITPSAVQRERNREAERIKKMSEKEYQEWYDYRKMIRNHLIRLEHDPWARTTKAGEVDFPARALLRMTGRYILEPWKYTQRTDEQINEYLDNPKPYLSFDDTALWKKLISKR